MAAASIVIVQARLMLERAPEGQYPLRAKHYPFSATSSMRADGAHRAPISGGA